MQAGRRGRRSSLQTAVRLLYPSRGRPWTVRVNDRVALGQAYGVVRDHDRLFVYTLTPAAAAAARQRGRAQRAYIQYAAAAGEPDATVRRVKIASVIVIVVVTCAQTETQGGSSPSRRACRTRASCPPSTHRSAGTEAVARRRKGEARRARGADQVSGSRALRRCGGRDVPRAPWTRTRA